MSIVQKPVHLIIEFGQWMMNQNWDCIKANDNPHLQVAALQETLVKSLGEKS